MAEREKILARIREALSVPAPRPEAIHGTHSSDSIAALSQDVRAWLPPGGQTFDESLALFSRNARDLKAEFALIDSAEQMALRVRALMDAEKWTKVATHRGELTDLVTQKLGLPTCLTDALYDPKELERCDVGITQCDALVAQTGSVLVSSRSAGGRALSALPPHHLVLARRSQLVPDLVAAFGVLKKSYAANYPSFISFITGPSRTGDIERILVLGAHGPKRLTILCW